MSGTEIGALLGGLSLLVTSIGGIVVSIMSLRVQHKTQHLTEEVHIATNSMKDQLVAATAQASEAKGRDEERATNRAQVLADERGVLDTRVADETRRVADATEHVATETARVADRDAHPAGEDGVPV